MSSSRWLPVAAICAVASACSGHPSPERTTILSQYDDSRVGSKAAEQLAAEVGLLGDEELDAYMTRIGEELLAELETQRFEYSFDVIDMVEPNALALPGGYIFLTRGLLAILNDEDELACVLGHEIIHVARRHTARQQELDAAANPLLLGWRRAAHRAAYSREMEREADELGQRLCAAAGYDPRGMASLVATLDRAERMRLGFSREPSFFDTHPGSLERAATNSARAGKLSWGRKPGREDPRAALLAEIDGLDVGQRPQAGVFIEERFLHPDLDFQISFPVGWELTNTNRFVGAESREGTLVFLTADQPAGDPALRAAEWLGRLDPDSIRVDGERPLRIGSLPAWRLDLSVPSMRRPATGHVTFFSHGDVTYRVVGVAPTRAARSQLRRTLTTTRTFRPLSPENRARIEAHRLRVATAQEGETLPDLSARTRNTWPVARLAHLNALFSDHVFAGGELVKISRAEPYEPDAPDAR